jgi:hypothetical protein
MVVKRKERKRLYTLSRTPFILRRHDMVKQVITPCLFILFSTTNQNQHNFFKDIPIYLQSVYIHSNTRTISKLYVEKRGRVEECSVVPLRDKRVKTLCGCRGKKVTN